jgi:phospholipid transport system transporter-binding protein
VLVLPAEITHAEASACLSMLLHAAHAEAETLTLVDAAALTRFDSSALAVLLECRRQCLQDGKGFAVHALPARLRELAQLYGVAELLPDLA